MRDEHEKSDFSLNFNETFPLDKTRKRKGKTSVFGPTCNDESWLCCAHGVSMYVSVADIIFLYCFNIGDCC